MAKVHVYVRVQVEASPDGVQAIEQAVTGLREAVEGEGGEWHGGVSVTGVAPVAPTPPVKATAKSEPAPVVVDDEEEFEVDEDDEDDDDEPGPLSTKSLRPKRKKAR